MKRKTEKIEQKQVDLGGFILDHKGWAYTKGGYYVKPFQVEEPSDPRKRWFIRGYPFDMQEGRAKLRRFTVTADYIASPDWDRSRKRAAARLMAHEWNEKLYEDQLFSNAPLLPQADCWPQMPIQQAIEYFLNMHRHECKFGSIVQYRDSLRKFSSWLALSRKSNIPLDQLTYANVSRYHDWLKEKKLSPATINNHRNCLSVFIGFYIGRKILTQNPVSEIRPLKTTQTQRKAFSALQRAKVKAYLEKKKDYQLLLFISIIYYTLARPNKEVRLLRVADINADSVVFWGERVKNSRTKIIPIEPGLEELVTLLNIRQYPGELYIFGREKRSKPQESDPSISPSLHPVGHIALYLRHQQALKKVGIEGAYTIYSWKDSGAIELYRATKDIKLVQHRCGHSSVAETEKYLRNLGEYFNQQSVGYMASF